MPKQSLEVEILSDDHSVPPSGVVEHTLRTYFDRHPPSIETFACAGDHLLLAKEITVLREHFGWKERRNVPPGTLPLGGLLFAIGTKSSAMIDATLSEAGQPPLVVLHIEASKKKTTIFAQLEACGYRIYREWDEVAYLYRVTSSERVISGRHILGDAEIRAALEKSWRRIHKLPENTKVDRISLDARELLVPERFDIAIKSHYARLWLIHAAKSWREYAYSEQALRITGPGADLFEYDGTGKNGLEGFLSSFHSLLDDVDPAKIPSVPVDSTLAAYDGAHRISAAIARKRLVHCAKIDSTTNSKATAAFFQGDSHGHPPLPNDILDESAIEYCRVKDTTAIALIFPTVASEERAIRELSDVGDIVYRKDIMLSPKAGGALLRQVYQGQPWLGQDGPDHGFLNKQRSCFPFSGVLRVCLLDRINPKTLRPAKERIRLTYGVGNHSIHITDSREETLRVARALFNRNSVGLLNMGIGTLPGFHEKLFLFRDWLETNGIDEEMVCIDGSAILALLGLRECRDLDFLYNGDSMSLPPTPEKIGCHNSLEHHYSRCIGDIVGDPRLHCWYLGVKLCTPHLVCDMKRRRGEAKDHSDVIMLQSRLPKQRDAWFNTTLGEFVQISAYFRARSAVLSHRIKDRLRPLVNIIRSRL